MDLDLMMKQSTSSSSTTSNGGGEGRGVHHLDLMSMMMFHPSESHFSNNDVVLHHHFRPTPTDPHHNISADPPAFLGTPINLHPHPPPFSSSAADKKNSTAAIREMIFRIAAMQPIHIDPDSVKPPKRRNVKISKDPQSVAARHRRERISERIRILQRLVPGGTKMDTASMLDEAIHYVKFLKKQVQSLEQQGGAAGGGGGGFPFAPAVNINNNNNVGGGGFGHQFVKNCQPPPSNGNHVMLGSMQMML